MCEGFMCQVLGKTCGKVCEEQRCSQEVGACVSPGGGWGGGGAARVPVDGDIIMGIEKV